MNRLSTKTKFLLVALVSVAAHLPGITNPLLDIQSYRQTQTATISRNFYEDGGGLLNPRINWAGDYSGRIATEFPVYNWLMAALWPAANLGDLWGRILSSVFGLLCALYLFFLVRETVDEETAFLSGLVFSVLPISVYFTRTVQPEAMALWGIVGGLYHVRKAGFLHAVAASCLLALAPLAKMPYAFVWLPAAWLVYRARDPRRWAVFLIPVLSVYGWYFYRKVSLSVVPSTAGALMDLVTANAVWFKAKFYQRLFLSRFPDLVTTYPGLALFGWGLWKGRSVDGGFFGVWLLATVLYLVAGGHYTYVHEYTLLTFAPVVAVFIAFGAQSLRQMPSPRRRAAALFMLAAIPLFTAVRIRKWYDLRHVFLLEAKPTVDRVSGSADLFLCNDTNEPLYLYHVHRRGFGFRFNDPVAMETLERFTDSGAKFFMTSRAALEGAPAWKKVFQERFPLVGEGADFMIYQLNKPLRAGESPL